MEEQQAVTRELVEVESESSRGFDYYHEVAAAINNGAFAVLVTAAVLLWLARGLVKRSVDSYEELITTLKKSVENNARTIDRLADGQTRMVDILGEFKHSPYGNQIINELNRQAQELREINEDKAK